MHLQLSHRRDPRGGPDPQFPIPHSHRPHPSKFTAYAHIPPPRHPPLHLRIPTHQINIRPPHNLQNTPLHHPPTRKPHRPPSPHQRRAMVPPSRPFRTQFNDDDENLLPCDARPRGGRMVGEPMGCRWDCARGYGYADPVVRVSQRM